MPEINQGDDENHEAYKSREECVQRSFHENHGESTEEKKKGIFPAAKGKGDKKIMVSCAIGI